MSTADVRNVVKVPGRLYWNPVSPASPTGAMGLTKTQRFLPNVRTAELTAEEWGGIPYEVVYSGEAPVFLAIMRDWDATMVNAVFPMSSGGGALARVRSGSKRAGSLMGRTKGGVLYFKPDSDTDPGVWLYRAIPLLDAASELTLRAGEEIGVGVAFLGTPDAQGRVYAVDTVARISP